jgi:hypothetical protein
LFRKGRIEEKKKKEINKKINTNKNKKNKEIKIILYNINLFYIWKSVNFRILRQLYFPCEV